MILLPVLLVRCLVTRGLGALRYAPSPALCFDLFCFVCAVVYFMKIKQQSQTNPIFFFVGCSNKEMWYRYRSNSNYYGRAKRAVNPCTTNGIVQCSTSECSTVRPPF